MKNKAIIGIASLSLIFSIMAGAFALRSIDKKDYHDVHADGAHQHNGITFDQEWTSSNSLPSEAGKYYLGTDIVLTSGQEIKGDVSICLNGHSILWGGVTEWLPTMLRIDGYNFDLCDCGTTEHKAVWDDSGYLVVNDTAEEKDVVTTFVGGYIAGHHDEVFSVTNSKFNIYGGTLIGNGRQEEIGGDHVVNIYREVDFRMYGGNFLGNLGGAFASWNSEQRNTVEFHGGRFSYNKVNKDSSGGAISCGMLVGGSPLILENIELSYNEAGNGGALFSSSNMIMKEGTNVHHNSAVYSGGGFELISSDDGTDFSIIGGTISDNYATHSGGGIEYTSFSNDEEGPKKHSSLNMSGGVITNNKAHSGGGIFAYTASTHPVAFNMTGGEISNNTAYSEEKVYHSEEYGDIHYYDYGYGGGVRFGSGTEQFENVFRLSGGEIINNNAGKGGGVYADSNTNFEVFGNPTVTGNKNIDNEPDEINLYIRGQYDSPNYVEPKIEIPSALDENAHLGIRLDKPTVFTKGLTDGDAYASNFYSCDETYAVFVNEDEQLYLDLAHTHDWSYQANGNKITASCSASDCPVTDGLTLELEAPASLKYDGTAKAVTFKTGYNKAAFPNPEIKYFKGTTEVSECINAGTYKAKVTFGSATAEIEFTIAKADLEPSPEAVSDRNAIYGQSLSEIDLPDGWTWNKPTDKVGNVGTNQHKATFTPEDSDNYNTVEQDVNVIVAKADPEYTVPTGLKVLHDKTLSTVRLPAGWSWDDPTINVGSELGTRVYKGTFTPEDTHNYNLVEHVDITVQVVDHEHSWSYTASGASITASCSASDCPVTEGLTLELEAPSGDMHYDGNAKLATLKAGYSEEAFPDVAIKYFQGSNEVNECVNVGKYTAKISFDDATASVEFEILANSIIDPNSSDVSIEVEDAVVPNNIELRVEVRADVKEKEIEEDYAKIKEMLKADEQIFKVYDVKLIQTIDGVEKEIQPSDIKPGLKITVRMAIPDGIDMAKVRIIHIHSVTDMEVVDDYQIDGNNLVFKIDRLSQFAFAVKVNSSSFPLWLIPIIIVGSLLLLCLIFLLVLFLLSKFIVTKEDDKEKVVRAIKIGKDNKDNKDYLKMMTFKCKKELKPVEEVFDNKKDAEDFLNRKDK